MKRILFDVPKWHLLQHRESRQLSLAAPNDGRMLRLEDELFERLYAGECDRIDPDATNPALRTWAERIHATCEQLPAFTRLAAECRGDAAAASAAVETLLDEIPDLPSPDAPPPPAGSSKDPLRRPLARACAEASRAVEDLRDATDGLASIAFGPGTGTEIGPAGTGEKVLPLAARLRDDVRLRRIALLAGRLKRIAASKRRQRVKHGADEITDIEQGADLARALPAELSKLTHPLRRLDFMRGLLERQVLQYQLMGSETLGRGPLCVLLDKSSSMSADNGSKDIWATALALALLEHAHAEHRPFALIDFNGAVIYETLVMPGDQLPQAALFVGCAGGTSIATAVDRGLELIRASPGVLRKSDLVLITDGGSTTDDAPALRVKALAQNVTILGLAIGMPPEVLAPWCDEAHGVINLSTVDEGLAAPLFS